jgi:hypothetical protein
MDDFDKDFIGCIFVFISLDRLHLYRSINRVCNDVYESIEVDGIEIDGLRYLRAAYGIDGDAEPIAGISSVAPRSPLSVKFDNISLLALRIADNLDHVTRLEICGNTIDYWCGLERQDFHCQRQDGKRLESLTLRNITIPKESGRNFVAYDTRALIMVGVTNPANILESYDFLEELTISDMAIFSFSQCRGMLNINTLTFINVIKIIDWNLIQYNTIAVETLIIDNCYFITNLDAFRRLVGIKTIVIRNCANGITFNMMDLREYAIIHGIKIVASML